MKHKRILLIIISIVLLLSLTSCREFPLDIPLQKPFVSNSSILLEKIDIEINLNHETEAHFHDTVEKYTYKNTSKEAQTFLFVIPNRYTAEKYDLGYDGEKTITIDNQTTSLTLNPYHLPLLSLDEAKDVTIKGEAHRAYEEIIIYEKQGYYSAGTTLSYLNSDYLDTSLSLYSDDIYKSQDETKSLLIIDFKKNHTNYKNFTEAPKTSTLFDLIVSHKKADINLTDIEFYNLMTGYIEDNTIHTDEFSSLYNHYTLLPNEEITITSNNVYYNSPAFTVSPVSYDINISIPKSDCDDVTVTINTPLDVYDTNLKLKNKNNQVVYTTSDASDITFRLSSSPFQINVFLMILLFGAFAYALVFVGIPLAIVLITILLARISSKPKGKKLQEILPILQTTALFIPLILTIAKSYIALLGVLPLIIYHTVRFLKKKEKPTRMILSIIYLISLLTIVRYYTIYNTILVYLYLIVYASLYFVLDATTKQKNRK